MEELSRSDIEIGVKLVNKEDMEIHPVMMYNYILIPKGSVFAVSRIDMGIERNFFTVEFEDKDICDKKLDFHYNSLYKFNLLEE